MDKRKSKDAKKGVVSLADYRKNKNDEKMREYERILFNRILGVYSFAERSKLHHVEVMDISFSGIRFREASPDQPFNIGDQLALRFYFTPATYLRLIVEVSRKTRFEDDGRKGIEYGCKIDQKTRSFEVIQQLIGFMQKYIEIAVEDENPPMIWF